jgi:hypothetical protein
VVDPVQLELEREKRVPLLDRMIQNSKQTATTTKTADTQQQPPAEADETQGKELVETRTKKPKKTKVLVELADGSKKMLDIPEVAQDEKLLHTVWALWQIARKRRKYRKDAGAQLLVLPSLKMSVAGS